MKTVDGITIDREFRNLIPAISPEERSQLEANLVEHGGARDPLVVWRDGDRDTLIDGHNRYEICTRLGLPYEVEALDFGGRDEAADWIDRNQLGRRNLSKQDYKLLLGRRYNRAKKAEGGRADRTFGVEKVSTPKTAERLAKEHGVNEKTVRNAGKFQEAAAKLGIEKEIAAGKVKATEAQVVKVAKTLPDKPTRNDVEKAREEIARPRRRVSKPAVEVFKEYPPTRCLEAVAFYAQQFLERCPSRSEELRGALVSLIASCDATR